MLAENMRTGKPWEARSCSSLNGQRSLPKRPAARTACCRSRTRLKDAGDVRVFAVAGAQRGLERVGLQGSAGQGQPTRLHLPTGRPIAAAGTVPFRGCIRHAADDALVVEKDKGSWSRFSRPNWWAAQIMCGEFGSFHAYFALPPTTPQASTRALRDPAGKRSYQGVFVVPEYQLGRSW
jgi:hypothetical protein